MSSSLLRGFSVCVIAALAACAAPKAIPVEKSKTKPPPEPPKLVGRVASIPADKRFVLIQSYGTWKIETGTILTTRGPDDRTACLLTTGESLGQFAAADLQSGRTEVGDAVYYRHLPTPPEPPTPPQPTEIKPIHPPAEPRKNN